MTKNIFKEIVIILLLCLAIILLLGILLYDYVPMTKTIPNPVSYKTPENVEQELAETQDIDESQVVMTYEVDSTDLNNYKRIQDYKPGKANPFSSYATSSNEGGESSERTGGESSNTGSSSNNNNSTTTTTNGNSTTTSGGQFFQDKGTK